MQDNIKRPKRRDIEVKKNPELAGTLAGAIERLRTERRANNFGREDERRFRVRKSLIEPDRCDPNGFERVLGISDLMSLNFLDRGRKAAAAVCRIAAPTRLGPMSGTGFLVGRGLLLTNNHVLGTVEQAGHAIAIFEHEHDIDGALKPGIEFSLAEGKLFFTDPDLDITLVAVASLSRDGVPIERYGYLPLIPLSGKAVHGERVTIVQHPGGQPKQIAIHSSRIIELPQKNFPGLVDFIHYTTDTEPGSSGAPVFNDQWQVVAVHHKAIPAPGSVDAATKPDGTVDYTKIDWIANEGIRVSAIFHKLQLQRLSNPFAGEALERIEKAIGMPPLSTDPFGLRGEQEADRPAHAAAKWNGWASRFRLGYDPNFLSAPIDFAAVLGPQKSAEVATLKDGRTRILDYLHFSVAVHAERKFAMMTAVNIDGARMVNPGGRSGGWRRDARMDDHLQPAGNLYEKKLSDDPVQFSRGHLVRRADPCWGTEEEAKLAEEHTFHYSNAAPQVQKYNDIDWGNLEDYLLDIAQRLDARMTVFTGPIFRDADPEYGHKRPGGPWKIPTSYWKVAVLERPRQPLSAAAFVIGQVEYIRALYEKKVFTSLTPYSVADIQSRHIQMPIPALEKVTGLDFAAARPFDRLAGLESTRFIVTPGDVSI